MTKKKRSRLPAGVMVLADGRYRVRQTHQSPHGKRRSVMRTLPHGSTLVQAIQARDQLRAELESEVPTGPPASLPQLGSYANRWLERKAASVRPKTAETYTTSLAHLIADLGHLPVDALERHHLTWWRDQLQEDVGVYALSTVRARWRYGLSVIRDALAEHGLQDITWRIKGPTGKTEPRRETQTLSRAQVDKLCQCASGRYATMVVFLARTGARFGEAAGLRWCDVDLEAKACRLRQSITEIKGGFQRKPLKSARGRVVGLSDDLVAAFQEQLRRRPGVGEALVWATKTGQPCRKIYIYRALDRAGAAARLDIEVRPQVLRRTVNSLGLAGGLDRVLLQELLGHADDDMTRHYHGLRPETAAAAMGRIWT